MKPWAASLAHGFFMVSMLEGRGILNPTAFLFWSWELEIKPSYPEFKRMAAQGNLISVYGEFLFDTETPVSVYLKIKEKSLLIPF